MKPCLRAVCRIDGPDQVRGQEHEAFGGGHEAEWLSDCELNHVGRCVIVISTSISPRSQSSSV